MPRQTYFSAIVLVEIEPTSVDMEFVTNQKGKQNLVIDNYMFSREKSSGNKTIWRCVEYYRAKCNARCHTADGVVSNHLGTHNHTADAAYVETKKVVNGM